jgi:23S rRNA (cytosine1962-C5)-methyltransferase
LALEATFAAFDPPPRLVVRRERAESLKRRHPWVFAGQLAHPPKSLPAGVIVDLHDEQGGFLARGGYNGESRIAVRVLGFDPEPIDAAFIARRVRDAVARRNLVLIPNDHEPLPAGAVPSCGAAVPAACRRDACTTTWPPLDARQSPSGILPEETDAARLIFAEADRLPGIIVDRYGDWLVLQILSAAMERWREVIVAALVETCAPRGIYERSEGEDRRQHEGLEPHVGTVWGEEPPDEIVIRENGLCFAVDVRGGQKTGFYLDQRDNRAAVAAHCAGAEVLNAFSYSGGFGLYAAQAGAARVTHVDSSAAALELCAANIARNPSETVHELVQENVFDALRRFRAEGRGFDFVILDPPKFAASRQALERAARGYRDLNAGALRLLAPGGRLATFSCSGAVDRGLFNRIVADAAVDAGRDLRVIAELGHPGDHPVLMSFPEGVYLKGLLAEVV